MDTESVLSLLESEYVRERQTGLEHKPAWRAARESVCEAYPRLREVGMLAQMHGSGLRRDSETAAAHKFVCGTGQLARRLKSQFSKSAAAKVATPNGNGNHNGNGSKRNGENSPTKVVIRFLEKHHPAEGSLLMVGDLRLLTEAAGYSMQGWRYPFQQTDGLQTAIEKAGWRFDIVDNTMQCFTVRVTAAPRSEADRMKQDIADMEAALASAYDRERQRRIAEIKQRYSRD